MYRNNSPISKINNNIFVNYFYYIIKYIKCNYMYMCLQQRLQLQEPATGTSITTSTRLDQTTSSSIHRTTVKHSCRDADSPPDPQNSARLFNEMKSCTVCLQIPEEALSTNLPAKIAQIQAYTLGPGYPCLVLAWLKPGTFCYSSSLQAHPFRSVCNFILNKVF